MRQNHWPLHRWLLTVSRASSQSLTRPQSALRGLVAVTVTQLALQKNLPTRACDEHIPRLVIAKQHEAVHEGLTEKQLATCGVLVPNPYFGDLNNDWPRDGVMLVNTPLDAIDAIPSSTQERKAELLKVLEAEKAQAPPSFAELLRLENCEARMTSLVEITKPRTRGGGRHCIHGGRKECPDVGFQRRGAGKEACALLAKLVT